MGTSMRRFPICLLSIAFSGCTTLVPVVKAAPKCDTSRLSEMLVLCGDPVAIDQGITFGGMIDVARQDRESLRACAFRHKSLADAIAACNDSIDRYNAEIGDINARNAAKP